MNHLPVDCVLPTKDRYFTTLPVAIAAIANQTRPPKNLFILDDGEHRDLREVPLYDNIFKMLLRRGIEWHFVFGERRGLWVQHLNGMKLAKNEFIWRVDDDDMPEPNVLETLYDCMTPEVGAVGSLVWFPDMHFEAADSSSMIYDIASKPNLQWSNFRGIADVDHLNNTFLYRVSAAVGYPDGLSPVSHREDTLFSYAIKLNGYRVLVNGNCVTWHLRDPNGGIRAYDKQEMYDNDERVFQRFLIDSRNDSKPKKYIVLNGGLGDHLMFRQILPEVKAKFADHRILLATCYPEVFENDDVELISIDQAIKAGVDIKAQDIYIYCDSIDWQGTLIDAMRQMHLS